MKKIIIRNNSCYSKPDYGKDTFKFASPESATAQNQLKNGYQQRLNYEYDYCVKHGGHVFMYTLTFNDRAMQKFYGYPVHDYRKFRKMCEFDGFRKELQSIGVEMKYFLACELGEGKGKRGVNNNPHFHVVFFCYGNISAFQFRDMIRKYWCFYHIKDKPHRWKFLRYKYYRYGKCDPCSLNCGEVVKYDALNYVVKYVIKDIVKHTQEKSIIASIYRTWYNSNIVFNRAFHLYYINECDAYRFQSYLKIKYNYDVDLSCLVYFRQELDEYIEGLYYFGDRLFLDSLETYRREKIKSAIKDYKRYFKPKVRVSRGVGASCVSAIGSDSLIRVNAGSKVLYQKCNGYAFRKKYYNTEKSFTGNTRYVLNMDGILLKLNELEKIIKKTYVSSKSNLDFIRNDPDLYNEFICETSLPSFGLDVFTDDLLKKFSIYTNVFKDRYYKNDNIPNLLLNFGDLVDVRSYLHDVLVSQESDKTFSFVPWYINKDTWRGHYTPFSQHPSFAPDISLFCWLDLLNDYICDLKDVKLKNDDLRKDRTRKAVNNICYD